VRCQSEPVEDCALALIKNITNENDVLLTIKNLCVRGQSELVEDCALALIKNITNENNVCLYVAM
jgi:hypothetical protein